MPIEKCNSCSLSTKFICRIALVAHAVILYGLSAIFVQVTSFLGTGKKQFCVMVVLYSWDTFRCCYGLVNTIPFKRNAHSCE